MVALFVPNTGSDIYFQSSKSARRLECFNVGELRSRYITLGIEK